VSVSAEFSNAFSTAFDALEAIPAMPTYCWPVNWACDMEFYTELTTMEDPENPGVTIPNPEGIAVAEWAESLAAQTMRMLTGYKVGGCPVVLRPCTPRCIPGSWLVAPGMTSNWAGYSGWTFSPYIGNGGQWLNACGCKSTDSCSCVTVQEVILPKSTGFIREVSIDGAVLDPSAYRVDNGNRLVRTDGGTWPACQDMNLDGGEGTFIVIYQEGAEVDALGAWAAGRLASEFARSCTGGACQLPPNVVTVTRSGVTMELAAADFPTGRTGLREVDLYVQNWNPYGMRSEAEVFSIDVPTGRKTTWRAGA
jgi:hypothetical protein